MTPRHLLVFRILLVAAAVLATTMALLPHPPQSPIHGDKWNHMLAFGTLALLWTLAWPREPLHRIGERLSFLGALIEVFQSIPALHRDCDVIDWLADTYVVVCVLILVRIVRGRASTP